MKVDNQSSILGFHIFGVSKRAKQKPFRFKLVPGGEPEPQTST